MKCFEHCILAIRKYLQCCNATTQETDHFIEFIVPWENKNNNNHTHNQWQNNNASNPLCSRSWLSSKAVASKDCSQFNCHCQSSNDTPYLLHVTQSTLASPSTDNLHTCRLQELMLNTFHRHKEKGRVKNERKGDRVRKGIRVFYNIAQWEI